MTTEPLPEKATVLVSVHDLASQHWLEAVAKAAGYHPQAMVALDGFIVVRYGRPRTAIVVLPALHNPGPASALSNFEQENLDL